MSASSLLAETVTEFINRNHTPTSAHPNAMGYGALFTPGGDGVQQRPVTAEDAHAFKLLKTQWAIVNNELLGMDRHSPEANAKVQEMKTIVKAMYRLQIDKGGLEGIGKPGGPRDVLVIGAGPGGLAAATVAGTEGLDTLYLDASRTVGGQAKTSSRIENYMGFPAGISGAELTRRWNEQALRCGAESATGPGARAVKIEYDPATELKTVTLLNGKVIVTRTVILATGLKPNLMTFPGSKSHSIIYGDADRLTKEGAGKSVVVVGGSNGAAQAALGAARTAKDVTILSRSPLEKGMSDYQITALYNNPKIHVIIGDNLKELRSVHGRSVLITEQGHSIPADRTGMFVGGKTDLDWLPADIKLSADGRRVAVDGNLETNIPGVFAVGDTREGAVGRIGVAVGDGQVSIRSVFDYFHRNRGVS